MSLNKIYYLIIAVFLLTACGDELMNSIPLIEIDPGFSNPGFNSASIVSLNETEKYAVNYKRVYGISRELTMNLTVDAASLEKYNQENGTNYLLLPDEYYVLPESVAFAKKEKSVNFEIELYAKKIYDDFGSIELASNYVLPVVATTTETEGIVIDEDNNTLLVHIDMLPSIISVPAMEPENFYFSKGSETKEQFSIETTVNFEGVEESHLSLFVDDQASLLTNGDYTLLPAENYDFGNVYVNDYGFVVFGGEINASGLSEENTYLLPCRVQTSNPDYVISQEEPLYFVVNISELKVSITGASASEAVAVSSSVRFLNSIVNVKTNTLVSADLTILFNYTPSLITSYNIETGSNYLTLPEGTVSIEEGKIAAGTKSTDISFSIDIEDLPLSTSDHYLVPLVIATDELEMGSVSGSEVIYLDVTKSLAGTYNLNIIKNERTRNIGNTIWVASECQRAGDENWDAAIAQAQYGFAGDGDWYAVLFSVTNEDVPDMENCKKIEIFTFLELLESTGGTNNVTQNQSYFNTLTGEVYIDCFVYESWFQSSYKETYSFTLQ